MENAPAPEFCALCGDQIAEGRAQSIIEGWACEACAKKRAAARALRIGPAALIAILLALVPLLASYATESIHTDFTSRVKVTTRVLMFASSHVSELDMRPEGAADGPAVRSYSDPIALAFGGAAAAIGLYAAFRALKDGKRRALGFALAAIAVGGLHVLRGTGVL